MTSSSLVRRCSVLALLLSLASLAQASGSAEKTAAKAAQTAVKLALKQVKSGIKATLLEFDAAINTLGQDTTTQSDLTATMTALLADWTAAHDQIRASIVDGSTAVNQALMFALGAFQTATSGPLGGPYPDDYVPGTGGAFDDFVSGWHAELDKAELHMSARLGKLRKALGGSGLDFTAVTRPMILRFGTAINASSASSEESDILAKGLEIELAASLSTLDGQGLAVAGIAGGGLGSAGLSVQIVAAGLDSTATIVNSDFFGNWQHVQTVTRGNYLVTVIDGVDDYEVFASLGAR